MDEMLDLELLKLLEEPTEKSQENDIKEAKSPYPNVQHEIAGQFGGMFQGIDDFLQAMEEQLWQEEAEKLAKENAE